MEYQEMNLDLAKLYVKCLRTAARVSISDWHAFSEVKNTADKWYEEALRRGREGWNIRK